MLCLNVNQQIPFSRALAWWYKWYDEIGREALLRYLLGCSNPWNLTSSASNTTQPASAWKYATIRWVDFSGYLAAYPTFPNGNTTIGENWVNWNKWIQTTSTTTLTVQKIIQNYPIMKLMEVSSIEYVRFPLFLWYTVTAWGISSTYNNTSYTLICKSVNSAWTITSLKTVSSTFTNKTQNTWTSNDLAIIEMTNITGINPGDLVYFELTVQSDITSWHVSETTSMYLAHANDANSQVSITFWIN